MLGGRSAWPQLLPLGVLPEPSEAAWDQNSSTRGPLSVEATDVP